MTAAGRSLGSVCQVNPRDPALSASAPFVPMDAIQVGKRFPTYAEERGNRAGARARADDVLFARITPCLENGKVAQLPHDAQPTGGSTELLVVRPGAHIDPAFLYYWCLSPQVRDRAEQRMTGTTGRMRLPAHELAAMEIPTFAMSEQRRIVEILEDHLSRLDAAADYVSAAQRRSAQLRRAFAATILPTDVPTESLAALATESGYGTSTKCSYEGAGTAVARIPNIIDGCIDMSDTKRVVDPSVDLSHQMLTPGDLLVVRTNGSRDLIGRTAVVQPGIDASFASYLIRFRLSETVLPEWVQIVMEGPQARREIELRAASSAGQYNLSLQKLGNIEIPVVPIDQQSAAVQQTWSLEGNLRRLHNQLDTVAGRTSRLRRAVLAAAFSGKLTGRRTDDEVVEELAEAMD